MKTLNKIKDYFIYLYLIVIYTNNSCSEKKLNRIVKQYSDYIFNIITLDGNKRIYYSISYDTKLEKYNIELDGIISIVDSIKCNNFIVIKDIFK